MHVVSKRMIAIALLDSGGGGGSLNCVREKVLRDRIHGDASLQQDPIVFALYGVIFSAHLYLYLDIWTRLFL